MTKKRFGYVNEEQPEETKPGVSSKSEMLEAQEVIAQIKHRTDGRLAFNQPQDFALPPQRRGRRSEPGPKRTDVPREQLNVRIRPELKRAAAGLAGLQGMTLGDVVEAALIDYLQRARIEADGPK